jgi:hypothetical protein
MDEVLNRDVLENQRAFKCEVFKTRDNIAYSKPHKSHYISAASNGAEDQVTLLQKEILKRGTSK